PAARSTPGIRWGPRPGSGSAGGAAPRRGGSSPRPGSPPRARRCPGCAMPPRPARTSRRWSAAPRSRTGGRGPPHRPTPGGPACPAPDPGRPLLRPRPPPARPDGARRSRLFPEEAMPDVVFSVDQSRSMRDQAVPGHNRWHPDIPPAATVRPGDEFRMECREWTDGQIRNDDSANDVRDVDLDRCHMLSGPVAVEGAEPGDLLVVDILDLGPVPQEQGEVAGQGWGYTGIFSRANGGGFL